MAWLDRIGLEDADLLRPARRRAPRPARLLRPRPSRVVHRVGSAEVVTVPSTGLQFSPTSDVAEFVTAPPGYRLIELGDDGYSTSVVRLPEARYAPTQP